MHLQSLQDNIKESNKLIHKKILDAQARVTEKTLKPNCATDAEYHHQTFDDSEMYQDDAFLEPVTDFGIPNEPYGVNEAKNEISTKSNNETRNQDLHKNSHKDIQKNTDTHSHDIQSKNIDEESISNSRAEKSDVSSSKPAQDFNKQIANIDADNIGADIKAVDNPLALLQCSKAELIGEWDFEKWEYWLRQAELIPAVLNLAHKGVMTGFIGQESVFLIPKSKAMEQMAEEFFDRLVERLKQDWQNMQVSYQSTNNDMATPEQQMVVRKEQALAAAKVKVAQEPLVQELLHTYGGELFDINLNI